MINLKIDPEFQSQIPPLTDDEFKQLEENILKEGKLLSPLIVWNNTLVDGHNRYAILQKHPEIYFSTTPLQFENREETIAWICRNQLGRRNLSPEQKRYLLGKQYEAEKKAAKIFRGNQYTLAKKSGGDHGDNHHSGKKTCDRIAEENGVSRASVLRASHYTRGTLYTRHRHRRQPLSRHQAESLFRRSEVYQRRNVQTRAGKCRASFRCPCSNPASRGIGSVGICQCRI